MAAEITLNGIEKAISGLNYRNKNGLKFKLLQAIRGFYEAERTITDLKEIDTDELIRRLWETENHQEAILNKRKNFNSIKSTVNGDLKKAFDEGKNPEGIIIGPANTFTLSDEAKDRFLKTLKEKGFGSSSVDLDRITDLLKSIDDILTNSKALKQTKNMNTAGVMAKINSLLQGIFDKVQVSLPEGKEESLDLVIEEDDLIDMEDIEDEIVEIEEEDEDDSIEVEEDLVEIDDIDSVIEDDLEEKDEKDIAERSSDRDSSETGAGIGHDTGNPEDGAGSLKEQIGSERDSTRDLESGSGVDKKGDKRTGSSEKGPLLGGHTQDAGGGENGPEGELDKIDENLSVEIDELNEDLEEIDEADVVDAEEMDEDVEEVDEDDIIEVDEVDNVDDVDDVDEDDILDISEVDNDETEDVHIEAMPEQEDDKESDVSDFKSSVLDETFFNTIPEGEKDFQKARLLSEAFNRSLAAMDRFYNQYILIPEGEYILSSPDRHQSGEKRRSDRTLFTQSFYIGKFPVTNALFEIFVEKTGYTTSAEKLGHGRVYWGRSQKIIDNQTGQEKLIWNAVVKNKPVGGACWYQPFGPGSTIHRKRNHPVTQVSFEDAMAFAAWTGKRLPTETEWEIASRTQEGYLFPWGTQWQINACNVEESNIGDTTLVDKYIEFANDFGIADTLGNVMEWTSDRIEPSSGENKTTIEYIVKGGSWISSGPIASTHFNQLEPEAHSNILGFRCVAV